MKVKYSNNDEISLEGSRNDLRNLYLEIIGMQNSDTNKLIVNLDSSYDPAPYNQAANRIIFNISTENTIEIEGTSLVFSGTKEFLDNFSLNLPFGVDEVPYHVHYDYISFPQFLKDGSPEIVIEATS